MESMELSSVLSQYYRNVDNSVFVFEYLRKHFNT